MRNFFFILKSLCGGKSANTPPSEFSYASHGIIPAFLKPLALILLFVLGSVNVWGEEVTGTFTMKNAGQSSPVSDNGVTFTWSSSQIITGTNNSSGFKDKNQSGDAYMLVTIPAGATLTSISKTNGNNWGGSASIKVYTGNSTSGNLIATIVSGTEAYPISSNNTGTTYYLINNTGANAWINSLSITYSTGSSSVPSALSVPTGMSSGTPTMAGTTLSWNAVANATGYALTIGNNTPITTEFTTAAGKVSYSLTGLIADTEYTWKVKAVGDGENYSDSEDCAVQNFTTADDPSYLKVTYDFTNTSNYPDGFPATSSPAHTTTTATEYEFGGNTLKLYVPNNFYRDGSHLFFGQTAVSNSIPTGAYIEFPAIPDYKLTKVVLHENSNAANGAYLNIFSTAGDAMSTAVLSTDVKDKDATFVLNNPDYNTAYRITAATASKNLRFDRLVLTYAPKPAVSSIAIKTAPAKTSYTANENFDPSGLVITVNYEGGSSEDVTYNNTTASDFTFSPATSTALNATNTTVTVTYGGKTANQAITVNRIATSLSWSASSYTANAGDSYSFPTLTKTPANLAGVTYSSSNEDLAIIDENGDILVDDDNITESVSTTITAYFAQTDVYAAATSASYTLTINPANTPALEVDPAALNFGVVAVNENDSKKFVLGGEYLDANATYAITGAGAAMFSIESPTFPLTPNQGAIIEDVFVKYAPTVAGSHSATLTISSTGATPVEVALSGQAKERRTVTWYKGDSEELTAQERGSATTSVLDGDAVTAIPSAPASCDDAISFMGWTDAPYAKNDAAPTPLYTDVEDFPAISGSNATYYAVWAEVKASNGSVAVTYNSTNFPTTYAAAQDYELEGYTFNILQVYKNGEKMQWRKSGDSNGTGTMYNKDVFPGHISSIVVEFDASDSNKNHTLEIGNAANPTGGTSITPSIDGNTYTFDCSAYSYDYFVLTNGSGAGYTSSVTINYAYTSTKNYTTTCAAPVVIANPTFDVAGGIYNVTKTVKVNNYNSSYYYFYTLDGSTPAANNLTPTGTAVAYNHTTGIAINESCTLKVIAYDAYANTSDVTSATYTLNLPLTLAQFVAQKPTTDKEIDLTDAIVLGAQGKFIYVQQGNAAMALYNYNPASWVKGNKVTGIITGKYTGSYDVPELQVNSFGEATATGSFDMPTPLEITEENAEELLVESNMYRYAEIKDVNFGVEDENPVVRTANEYYYYDDALSVITGKVLPESTVSCDVKGIIYPYKSSGSFYYSQLAPIALSDIAAKNATAVLPAISPEGGADAENAEEVTYMSTVSVPMVENEKVYISVNNAEPALLAEDASVQIEGDVKLVVSAKRDFYADNTVTYYYKPSSYPKQIAVSSEHGDVTVKVGENVVTSALPESAVTFTVAEAAHFHIASVAVNYEGGSLTPALSEGKYSFTMPDKDVTIALAYTEDTHYTITYADGGATSGSAPTGALAWQYAGEDVELLDNEYVWDEDHNFTGWKVTYGETEWDKAVGQSFEMPAANVTITAQWVEKQYCALTLKVNGEDYLVKNIEQTIEQTISGLAGYENPANQNGYEFVGWATSQELNDVTETIETIENYTPEVGETNKTLYAVFKRVDEGAPKTDVLTAADLTATGTGYVEFSNVQKNSAAKYAGKTAKNGENIQLNEKSKQGIYSSVSGGTLVSIRIQMTSNTKDIGVYGSNTGFTGYTSIPSQGEVVEIEKFANKSDWTVTPSSDYKYVGITSATDGAKQISSISITWQPKTTYYTTAPSAVYAVSYALGGGAWKEDEGCDGANVKAGKTFDICESVPVRDHYKFNGWKVGDNTASGTITIDAATVITANWVPKVESNITYNAGTGTGFDAVVGNNEEGTEIVLPSASDKSISKEGYDFVGWQYNGNLYKTGTTFEMPASAVTFVAQWKKQNITKMTLVTNANQLVNGSQVIFVNQEDAAIAGNSDKETDTYMASEIVSFNEDKSVVTSTGNGIVMTLVQVEGGWAFKYNNKYLAPYSGNKMAWYSNATAWEITFDGVNAKIVKGSYAMRYNKASNAKRFAAYGLTGVEPIQLYASLTAITDTENPVAISDLGYVEGDVIVVNSGVELTMDAPSAPASITVKDGATVTISAATEADNLIVENGGKVTVSSSTTVNDLIIGSTMASGKSGQIDGATNINFEAVGDVYFDLTLGADGTSAQWHAFTVPFPVDALNGVYDLDGNKLTNEVNYAIMDYHGDIRANGEYGWKKYRGILQPGTFYLMTVDGDRTTYRFKKVAGADIVAENTISYAAYQVGEGEDSDKGWNGIGNPTLFYGQININVQVLNPSTYTYEVKTANSTNFVVGTPFFYQASTTSTISMSAASGSAFYAPKRQAENEIKDVEISFGNEEFKDHLYISAREEATNNYEIGKDLAKMMMTSTPSVAQIYGKAYNTNLCMIDAPLVNDQATYKFTLYAPTAGEYTITAPNMENVDIYLTKDDAIIWNISEDGYTLDMQQGFTTGYGLLLQVKAPEIATDIDNLSGNASGVQKVVIDDHVYILRGEKMYDTTGKIVK